MNERNEKPPRPSHVGFANKALIAGIALALLAATLPQTQADPAPGQQVIVVPNTPPPTRDYRGMSGYVWDEKPNHAHVALGLGDLSHTVMLSSLPINTRWVDLEITGLPTGNAQAPLYSLDGFDGFHGAQHFKNPVGLDGKAVFWSIPARSMDLTLTGPQGSVTGIHLTGAVVCTGCEVIVSMRPSPQPPPNATHAPSNATGVPPIPGSQRGSNSDYGPSGYQWCSDENYFCNFSGTLTVAYGWDGSYAYKSFTGGVQCNNANFGDPAYQHYKACYLPTSGSGGSGNSDYGPSATTWCADEPRYCNFSGVRDVYYGYDGYYTVKTGVYQGTYCDNADFDHDPYVGHGKSCYYGSDQTRSSSDSGSCTGSNQAQSSQCPPPNDASKGGQGTHGPSDGQGNYGPPNSAFCSHENEWCSVSGTKTVAYGGSGSYYYRQVTGGIGCDNQDFGDPIPYTYNACYTMNKANQPNGYQDLNGNTLRQAAIATAAGATVSTSGCYTHQVTVGVAVSGGGMAAGGSAGADYTYSAGECVSITAYSGSGLKLTYNDVFEKATYSDGSYRAYAKSSGPDRTVSPWTPYYICQDGTHNCFGGSTTLTGCNTNYHQTVTESNSGSAFVKGGWDVGAWSAQGSLTLQAQSSATIDFSITNPDCGTHTYYVGALAGNPHATSAPTGIIGFVET